MTERELQKADKPHYKQSIHVRLLKNKSGSIKLLLLGCVSLNCICCLSRAIWKDI